MIPPENQSSFLVPKQEVRQRLTALREVMRSENLELLWIEHLTDRYYLTGSIQNGVLLVPAEQEAVFLVRKSVRRAEVESSVGVARYPGGRAVLDEVRGRLGNAGRIGLAMDVTPACVCNRLRDGLDRATLVDVGAALRSLRAVKSPWEVTQIRGAAEQANTVLSEIQDHLRAGMSELELSGSVEGRLRALGHGGTIRVRAPGSEIAIATTVAGPSGLYPTNFNGPDGAEGPYPAAAAGGGWKRIVRGETVMLDIVTSYNGYHADTTRTFIVGDDLPDTGRRAHDFCREMLRRIEELLRPGASCADVYRVVTRLAEEKGEPQGFMGFGENRVKFLGHGVGLELDELPVLAEKVDTRLVPGMVLAVEPKAFLERVGPVGVENTYVIGEDGPVSLCSVRDDIVHV